HMINIVRCQIILHRPPPHHCGRLPLLPAQFMIVGSEEDHLRPRPAAIRKLEQLLCSDLSALAAADPERVRDLDAVTKRGSQSIERGNHIEREYRRAAATEGSSCRGIGPDHSGFLQ